MIGVDLAVAFTLWLTFGAFLFFGTIDAPPVFARTAIGMCASEFAACLLWQAADSCIAPGCQTLSHAGQQAAAWQIPGLCGLLVVGGVAYGLRVARSW
jgi:hypothetical protein